LFDLSGLEILAVGCAARGCRQHPDHHHQLRCASHDSLLDLKTREKPAGVAIGIPTAPRSEVTRGAAAKFSGFSKEIVPRGHTAVSAAALRHWIDAICFRPVKDDPIDRFLSLIQSDPTLQRELGITANDSAEKPKLSVQRFVELGERYGCRFTVEELTKRQSAPSRTLSAEELERVAGGTGRSHDHVGGYSFSVEIDGISLHRGGGFNALSLDDTAGKEK
jgi:hypothetical protein